MVQRVLSFLEGKKTYIAAIAIGAVVALQHLGMLDAGTAQTLLGLLGAGGLAALRSGVETNRL